MALLAASALCGDAFGAVLADQAGTFPGICPVSFWKPTASGSYIKSIQAFSITIASGSTSNTAAISSVTTNNAIIIFGGCEGDDGASAGRDYTYVTLTNSTTVTANRNSGTSATSTVKGTVVEFISSAINVAVQYGTITMGAAVGSNTATITSVDTTKAAIIYLGLLTSTNINGNTYSNIELTDSTTVTASRASTSSSVTVSFCVVEFTTAVIKSAQQRSVSLSTNSTSPTDTITSVTANNTMLFYGGVNSAVSAANSAMHYLTLTNGTTVTLPRQGTSTSTRVIKYCVVEFQSGILNQAVQRGTTDLATPNSSNTSTITSVSTSKAFINFCNFDTSNSSTTDASITLPDVVLTNSTTVTANRNSTTGDVLTAWEVAEFI